MKEQIIIKSERYNIKKLFILLVVIGFIGSLIIAWILCENWGGREYDWYKEEYLNHEATGICRNILGRKVEKEDCYFCQFIEENPSRFLFVISHTFRYASQILITLAPLAIFSLIGLLVYLWLKSYELTITDKRAYGQIAWGKRVDLPLDSISAIASVRILKGISVSTASGRISFLIIKNADMIYDVLNNLLIGRQRDTESDDVPVQTLDVADQLKKYKELLDTGIITQEEFDAKKKQLLGL